jgi:hypothetical protein
MTLASFVSGVVATPPRAEGSLEDASFGLLPWSPQAARKRIELRERSYMKYERSRFGIVKMV